MDSKLDRYLLLHFSNTFFPLFGALFLIASVVAFVQLSSLTAVLKVSFGEMFLLYSFQIPQTIIYTLPITFFASVMITLARLSSDLELIVLFSLKVSIWRILRPFFILASLLSISILVIGLQLQPKVDFLRQALIYAKQDEVQINIKASEFGQKFGDWLLFVGKEDREGSYRDIVLFSTGKENGMFIVAREAHVDNSVGILTLELIDGKSYKTEEDRVTQVDFAQMQVNEQGKLRNLEYGGIVNYWQEVVSSKSILRKVLWIVGAAIFVIISLPAAALGIHNPRFQKNRSGIVSLGLVLLYFFPLMTLYDKSIYLSILTPVVWLLATLFVFRRKLQTF